MHWHKEITRAQWRTLFAAQLGWMLDAMDVMLYAFALTAIRAEFGLTSAQAGALASVTLIASAAGGVLFGMFADRAGRTRALVLSILMYSVFTAVTATAHSVPQLVLWRSLVGIGLGGEWSAGSVLVAESWPARHRGKAIGLMQSGWAIGYIFAALMAGAVLPVAGWRALFALGVAPALFTFWIRRHVPEPPARSAAGDRPALSQIFHPPLLGRTVLGTLVCTAVLFAYWGLFTWIPAYLSSPVEKGGAGLSVFATSGWIVPMQMGAFLGYTSFGFLADRFGRRPVFVVFVLGAAALAPEFGHWGRYPTVLLTLGPLLGYFGHGYFSIFGAMLSELFPRAIRATAQGLCYNFGRAVSALAPIAIGTLADRYGIGSALWMTSLFYALGGCLIVALPETKGEELA